MKYVILGIVAEATILFILSVISYMTTGRHFKFYALGFLVTAVSVFILVLIRTLKEQFDIGKKG